MSYSYKVGDRVRRRGLDGAHSSIPDGTLGTLREMPEGEDCGPFIVDWDNGYPRHHASPHYLEPVKLAAPPPVPEPACPHNGSPLGRCGHHEHIVRQQQSTQQGLCGEPLAELIEEQRQVAAAVVAKTTFGDMVGERDRLKQRCAELETDLAYWKREAIRLKGSRR